MKAPGRRQHRGTSQARDTGPRRALPDDLIGAARRLAREVDGLRPGEPVAWIYNPLRYAWGAYEDYLCRFGATTKQVLFLGMNPGPWGMAQTGVPFGDVDSVREWLGISGGVRPPGSQHPRRPILGFECPRAEVSGRRLWGLMRDRFGSAAAFFRTHFIANYCPLLFLDNRGANITPDRLRAADREQLERACDRHLAAILLALGPAWAIGVGRFAESRIRAVVREMDVESIRTAGIPHPSPASPQANAGWATLAARQLEELGVWARS